MAQMTRPLCRHCQRLPVMRGARGANGILRFAWYCLACQRWAEYGGHWINHQLLTLVLERQGKRIEDIPLVSDDSDMAPCIICGAPGESHHWAPHHLKKDFGADWDQWPVSNLCRDHHALWHRILTPNMSYIEQPKEG